jgi:murein DD-endopeptidase MepM/ murein hydrolase activator NlpD
MPLDNKLPDQKDLALGDLNPTAVSKRNRISDTQKQRNEKTDYLYSRDIRNGLGERLAYVIEEGEEKSLQWSSSLVGRAYRPDTKLVVVKANLIDDTISPGTDEEIECRDGKKATENELMRLHWEFIAAEPGLPIPHKGDIIRVDFRNRSSKKEPIYLGMIEHASNRAGAVSKPTPSPSAAFEKNPTYNLEDAPEQATEDYKNKHADVSVSSPFGYRFIPTDPKDPTHRAEDLHLAVDISVPEGTPLFSVYDGGITMVKNSGQSKLGGRITLHITTVFNKGDIIDPDIRQYFGKDTYDGGETVVVKYLHLNAVKAGNYSTTVDDFKPLTESIEVKRGQFVGLSGNAGTGPHLHFEVSDLSFTVLDEDDLKWAKRNFPGSENNRPPTVSEMEAAINSRIPDPRLDDTRINKKGRQQARQEAVARELGRKQRGEPYDKKLAGEK